MSANSPEKAQKLKIDLMTEGLSISRDVSHRLAGPDNVPLTMSDYASTSGVTLKLEGDVWVNAPISQFNPNFVENPTNSLVFEGDDLVIRGQDDSYGAEFVPIPGYHDDKLEDGSPIKWIAVTHSDRVRLSPIKGCAIQCDFCDIPFDKPEGEPAYRGQKNIDNILHAARIALRDQVLPAQHMLVSGGTPRRRDYGYENEVYARLAAENPGVDVDVMMVPMPGLLDVKQLGRAGIHGLSINLELWNREIALQTMRSKAKASRELYLDFIANATEEFGVNGRVRSLLMVGIEPIEDTLLAVRALAERGCDPVLSPFRPDPLTPMRDAKPPTAAELLEVWQRSQDIVAEYDGVKLGPRCIPCMHNTLSFADGTDDYYHSQAGHPRTYPHTHA